MEEDEKKRILGALRFLDMLVVSLDRIGSHSFEVRKNFGDLLADFVKNHAVFQQAADARRDLSEFFSYQLPEGEDMSELEKLLKDVKYWEPPKDENGR